jgi:hypothetical protein
MTKLPDLTEISKSIFGGKLFISVGYGIKKKKSEKLFESAIYSLKKNVEVFDFDQSIENRCMPF